MSTSKRTFALGAGVTAIAAVVATPLLAGSAAASAHTFTLRMHPVADGNVDNKPTGFSAGDDELQFTRLTDAGKTVGWETGDCLATNRAKTSAHEICRFLFHLNGGEIVSMGAIKTGKGGPGTFVLAVTGGTGPYVGAQGEVQVTAVDGNSIPVTIDASY
jgi:hypothetical protein